MQTMLLLKNKTIRSLIVIIGVLTLWYQCTKYEQCTHIINAPVYIYNCKNHQFQAPKYVPITIQGARIHIAALHETIPEIHIDGAALHTGVNTITISEKNLLVPKFKNMLHLHPTTIQITL